MGRSVVVSSETIRKELIEIRQYKGLSAVRVRDCGPSLMMLAVTHAERRRLGLSPDDLHIAGERVIRCAIEHEIVRGDWQMVLTRTMNLDGETHGLITRRSHLRTELLFMGERELQRLEAEAYVELAGLLVAASGSPCDPPKEVRKIFQEQCEVAVELILSQESSLRGILRFLPMAPREAAEAILRVLPNFKAFVNQVNIDPEHRATAAHDVLSGIVDLEFPRYPHRPVMMEFLNDPERYVHLDLEAIWSVDQMQSYLLGDNWYRPRALAQESAFVRPFLLEAHNPQEVGRQAGYQMRADYYSSKATSMHFLELIIQSYEDGNSWPVMFSTGK